MNPPELHGNTPVPQAIHAATPPPMARPEAALPERPDMKTLFEALLRRPQALAARLGEPHHGATLKFALLALGSILLFGFVLGCFAKHEQLWAAPVKIGAGLLFSGLICFPSLYIFSTLAGARISVSQLAACLAAALALAGLLLLGFAPAVWIFAESTDSFGFMGFLAVGSWFIAIAFSLRFLKSAIVATGGTQHLPLVIWSAVFLLVTLQMTTTLRPILGRSEKLLTSEKKFFLEHWFATVGESLGKPVAPAPVTRNDTPAVSPASTASPATPSGGTRNPFNEN